MKNKPKNNVKYWEFKNQTATSADLYLYIEIASWGGGYAAHSAQSFKAELDALGEIDTLNIYINSPGGDVFEGIAIENMLKRHKAKKEIYIDGLAASIASAIAMSGRVHMPKNAMMMIHNAWTYTCGNSTDLREAADRLDKASESIRQSYVSHANGKADEETFKALMDNESWLTAQECFDYGLCDVLEDDVQIAAKWDGELLNSYKNLPKELFNSTKENDTEEYLKDEEIEALISRVNNIIKFEEAKQYE